MIQNTLNWYNGEIFEGRFIFGFGALLIISALLFYFYGSTPASKALLIPFIVIGVFFTITGINMNFSNAKKAEEAKEFYKANEASFIDAEIKRVEGFQYLYPMSIGISLVSFLVALGLLYFVKNIHWQAVAITLILFGTAFAVIDYFSKERALHYHNILVNKN